MNATHTEQWRPIPGWEGLYEVSSFGRVRSVARTVQATNRTMHYKPKVLKQNIDSGGYAQVTLCDHAKRRTVGVHVLVATAFLGDRPQGADICHNDGRATHNHPHNLRWGSRSENCKDKKKHGTHNFMTGFTPRDRSTLRDKAKAENMHYTSGNCGSSYVMGTAEDTKDEDWDF